MVLAWKISMQLNLHFLCGIERNGPSVAVVDFSIRVVGLA